MVTYVVDMPEYPPTVYTFPEIEDSVGRDSLGTPYETNCGPRDFALLAYPDPKDLVINFYAVTREITVHAQQGFT